MTPMEESSSKSVTLADDLHEYFAKELIYSCHEHDGYLDSSNSKVITNEDRIALVDWCYSIANRCKHSRDTVASAMEMVDRFLSPSKIMSSVSSDAARTSNEVRNDKFKFQLLTVTALYVAIKINESTVVSSDLFAGICRESHSKEDIEDMERILLSGLSWRCRAPTALQICQTILSLIIPHAGIPDDICDFLLDEMKDLTEVAVRDYYFSTQRPSTVAVAAILYAIRNHNKSKEQQEQAKVLEAFLSVTMDSFNFEDMERIDEAAERFNNSSSTKVSCISVTGEKLNISGNESDETSPRSFCTTFEPPSTSKRCTAKFRF